MVAIGGNFTIEARALFAEAEAQYFALSDFFWTDKSYINLHSKNKL